MPKNDTLLIHEKITVPTQKPRTSRPRLLELLTENLGNYSATIVNGRAGTGKTTLSADFARRTTRPVCWYKVDAADAELSVFLRYLLATLRLQCPTIDERHLRQFVESKAPTVAESLAEAVVFQLGDHCSEPLLVVIEDLHLIYDADWVVPFFHRLMPLLPADVHLILTCRSLPPAPLWRLRSKQMLRVIEEGELAFTLHEATVLFATYGLGEEHARAALQETNGRALSIANFAATPGRAGRAVADSFLAIRPRPVSGPLSLRTVDMPT
jgi:LuxR family maltose regulon positive regulatory protein